jgi:hypothetical protein
VDEFANISDEELRQYVWNKGVRRLAAVSPRAPVPSVPGVTEGVSTPVDTKPVDKPATLSTTDAARLRKEYQREWLRALAASEARGQVQ